MKKHFTKIVRIAGLFWLVGFLAILSNAYAETTTGREPGAVVLASGGTNAGGQSAQTDEFSGAATYSITLPVPPARGGIEPQLVLNYNSYRKNPNSWVGYGWELDLGAIERVAEPCSGEASNCNVIDYSNGDHFQARFAGQTETLQYLAPDVAATYGLSLATGEEADLYGTRIESAFNYYFHITNSSSTTPDAGWIVIDKSGRTYEFGRTSSYARDEEYRCAVGADPDACTEQQWIARWSLEKVTDPNGNILNVTYGADRLMEEITYQDITIEFDKSTGGSYYPTFRQGFLDQNQMGVTLTGIVVNQNDIQLQKFLLGYTTISSNNFSTLYAISQLGSTDSNSLPPTIFEYYDDTTIAWDSSAITRTASTDNPEGTTTGYLNQYTTLADMNGDGLVDLISSYHYAETFYVYYNNGNDFVYIPGKSEWTEPFSVTCTFFDDPDDNWTDQCTGQINLYTTFAGIHQVVFLMDMNGDSLPDRVVTEVTTSDDDNSEADFYIAFNDGNGWGSTAVWHDPFIGYWPGTSDGNKWFMDMNGDGLVDRVISGKCDEGGDECHNNDGYNEDGFLVYYNTGAGFTDTPVFWTDPLAATGALESAIGRLSAEEDDKVYATIKDINGDGLPDRIWQATVYSSGTLLGAGMGVALNRNGLEWAEREVNADGYGVTDGIDNLGFLDPVTDEDQQGYISSETVDLIDMNGDGYLDRVEGDTSGGRFLVYYFEGMSDSSTFMHFSNSYVFDDPVENYEDEYDAAGYINAGENDVRDIKQIHTFIADMNGDGYPDRVTTRTRDEETLPKYYYIYPMRVNTVTYSDSPSTWDDPNVNQPVGALKSIDDGQGNETGIEYLPSSWPQRFSSAYSDIPLNNRFLPFNLYVAHKIYSLDYTMPTSDASVEAGRWPGMRWTTTNYWGGNLFVRHAVRVDPSATGLIASGGIDTTYFSQFNGFQTVEKEIYRPSTETWDPITTTTVYHQAEGDIDPVDAADASSFVAGAYGHFTLSGKTYSSEMATATQTLITTSDIWGVNADGSDLFDCSGNYCFPYLIFHIKTVYEPGSSTDRRTEVSYAYDDTTGNITSEAYLNSTGGELFTKTTHYYSASDFDPTLQIRDRPSDQTQSHGGNTYRYKEFVYDSAGNPTNERFYTDTSNYVEINRTFNSNGTLQTITDVDNVTKTVGYDSDALFPETESVTLPTGTVLTTDRTFNRMSGKADSERNDYGIGKASTYDDFGRPEEEYIVASTGATQLDKEYSYEYVTASVENLAGVILLKTQIWVPQSAYADTSTNPAAITYTDASGYVLQKCSYTERGLYRLIQSRQSNGGRTEESTEPVFSSYCNFLSTISSGVRTYLTEKDYQGRAIYIEPPAGDSTSPMGNLTISYAVNTNHELVKTTTTSDGRTKQEIFDLNERLIKVTDPLSTELNYHYNAVGDLESVYEVSTPLTTIHYDLLGRKDYMTDADMGTWSYDYNAEGFLETQTDNAGQYVHHDYDSAGRISRKNIYNSGGGLEKYEVYTYDSGDSSHDVQPGELFQVEEFDATGTSLRWTRYGYDSTYRRISTITRNIPDVGELEQTLTNDFRGVAQSASYPGGENLYYTYDRLSNLQTLCSTSTCDTSSGEVYYSVDPSTGYDVYGGLQHEAFGNGITSDYSYYPNSHRLEQKTISNGSTVYSQRQYQYDIYANLMALSDSLNQTGTGALTGLSYDSLNRLTGYQQTSSATAVSLTYNANGNIETNSRYSASPYQYTSSRLHAVTQIGSDTFGYDNNGNMTSDPNRTMVYNAQNQLTQVTMQNGQVVTYDYDYTSARVEKHSTRSDYDYATHESTTYYLGDAMEIKDGDLIFHVNAKDQRIATKNLGSITDILASSGASLRPFGINPKFGWATFFPFFMMLMGLFTIASFRPIKIPSPVACPPEPWRRWRERARERGRAPRWIPSPVFNLFPPLCKGRLGGVDLALKTWSSYTRSLHEALHALSRRTAFKFVALALIFVSFAHLPLHSALAGDTGTPSANASDANYFYYSHGDHLGSNHILTEGSHSGQHHSGLLYNRGTLIQRIEFAPFGQETYVLNPSLQFDPRYTNQTYDLETGLYYYKARYYNPLLGRFIQPDTIVPSAKDLQAYNRYSYVMNNPLKYVDPTGHFSWSAFRHILGAFVRGILTGIGIAVAAYNPALGIGLILAGNVIGGAISGGVGGILSNMIQMSIVAPITLAAIHGGALGVFMVMGAMISPVYAMTMSYKQGGWEGLATFGAGLAGAILGGLAGAAIVKSQAQSGSGYANKVDNTSIEQSRPLADNGNMSSDPNVASDAMSPYETPTGQAIADNQTNAGAVVVDLRNSGSSTLPQNMFNSNNNSFYYWTGSGTIAGATTGFYMAGPVGALGGAVTGFAGGTIVFLIGYKNVHEGSAVGAIFPFGPL